MHDVSLVECYTSQRVGDNTNFTPNCFTIQAICEKYDYQIPSIDDQILNCYIKDILTELSKTVPSLAKKVPTVLTMKQRAKNAKGQYVITRANSVTTHTAWRNCITNMYLNHKFTINQMIYVSGHKTQKVFMDYIKLSSEERDDEIDAIVRPPIF